MVKGSLIPEFLLELTVVSLVGVKWNFWDFPFNEDFGEKQLSKDVRMIFQHRYKRNNSMQLQDRFFCQYINLFVKATSRLFSFMFMAAAITSPVNWIFLCCSDCPGFMQSIWLIYFILLPPVSLSLMVLFLRQSSMLKKSQQYNHVLHCKFSPNPGLNSMSTEGLICKV